MTLGLAARLLTVALLCVPMMACSVANYRKPVDDFARATRDTAEALSGLDKQVTDGYADVIRKRVIARKLQAAMQQGDCQTAATGETPSIGQHGQCERRG
jgi:hypothetical protein